MSLPNNITFSNLEELNDTLTSLQGGGGSVGPTGPQGATGPTGEIIFTSPDNVLINAFGVTESNYNLIVLMNPEAPYAMYVGLGITLSNVSNVHMTISFNYDCNKSDTFVFFTYGTGTPPVGNVDAIIFGDDLFVPSMFGPQSIVDTPPTPNVYLNQKFVVDAGTKHFTIQGSRTGLNPNEVYWFDIAFSPDLVLEDTALYTIRNVQVNTIAY